MSDYAGRITFHPIGKEPFSRINCFTDSAFEVAQQIAGEKSYEGQLKLVAENKVLNEDSEVGNNPNIFVTLNIDGGGKRAKPGEDSLTKLKS